GWVLWLRSQYGLWPVLPAQGNFARPLSGLWYAWTHLRGASGLGGRRTIAVNGYCLLLLAVQVLLVGVLLLRRPDPVVFLAALGGVVLVLTAGVFIYEDKWSFMRVFAWLPSALWLGFARAGVRWPLALLAAPAVLAPLVLTSYF